MRFRRYRGRHLVPRPNPLAGPAVAGTATAILMSGGPAAAGTHTVKPGETLSGIAHRYGTTADHLARANGIGNANRILAGARLRVPGSEGATGQVHEVRAGETLSSIAARYGTTIESIAKSNKISDPNMVVIGQELRVTGASAVGAVSAPSSQVHEVQAGETLSSIAARYGTTIESIAKANKISDPNMVVIGQELRVPGASAIGVNAAPGTPTPDNVESILETQARDKGLDDSLVKAVVWHESAWHQEARSSTGAIGIMQVMPGTADFVNEVLGTGDLNVKDAVDNVELGVTYLDHVIDGQGDERKGLAAYYSGPGNVGKRLKGYQESYVDSVEDLKGRF